MASVPKNEVSHLFSVRSKCNEVSVGTWARVKNGKYKGDLAQVLWVWLLDRTIFKCELIFLSSLDFSLTDLTVF